MLLLIEHLAILALLVAILIVRRGIRRIDRAAAEALALQEHFNSGCPGAYHEVMVVVDDMATNPKDREFSIQCFACGLKIKCEPETEKLFLKIARNRPGYE